MVFNNIFPTLFNQGQLYQWSNALHSLSLYMWLGFRLSLDHGLCLILVMSHPSSSSCRLLGDCFSQGGLYLHVPKCILPVRLLIWLLPFRLVLFCCTAVLTSDMNVLYFSLYQWVMVCLNMPEVSSDCLHVRSHACFLWRKKSSYLFLQLFWDKGDQNAVIAGRAAAWLDVIFRLVCVNPCWFACRRDTFIHE